MVGFNDNFNQNKFVYSWLNEYCGFELRLKQALLCTRILMLE